MRQIDLFNCSGNYTDHLAYNEGVYNCIGDDGNHCYKRPDGKIIIDQVQDTAYPFLGNIAKVPLLISYFIINQIPLLKTNTVFINRLYHNNLSKFEEKSRKKRTFLISSYR